MPPTPRQRQKIRTRPGKILDGSRQALKGGEPKKSGAGLFDIPHEPQPHSESVIERTYLEGEWTASVLPFIWPNHAYGGLQSE